MDSLYKERLIEIYAEKKHFGKLKDRNYESSGRNPGCDDEITIELKVDSGKIVDARFNGKACFVSTLSAEVLMENIIGMKLEDTKNLGKEDLDKFLGTEVVSTRTGCEVFPLDVLKNLHKVEGVSD